MENHKRLHREDPARSAPLRSFGGVFRQEPGPGFSGAAPANGTANSTEQAGRDEPVGLAYRVIEKHINDGKQNAGLFNGQPYHHNKPVTDGFQEILDRIIRFQSEILPLFIEALTSAVSAEPMKTPGGAAPSHPASDRPTSENSQAISVEVASTKPVQVSIDLKENSEMLPLVTLGLRAVGKDTPLVGDITFAPGTSGNPIQLRVAIANDCAPGAYSGVIVNQVTGDVRGTLTVRVGT